MTEGFLLLIRLLLQTTAYVIYSLITQSAKRTHPTQQRPEALSFVLKICIIASKPFYSTSLLQTSKNFTKEIIAVYTGGNWGWENPNHTQSCSGTWCCPSLVFCTWFYCHLPLLLTSECYHHLSRLQWSHLPKLDAHDKDCWRVQDVTEQFFDSKSMVKTRIFLMHYTLNSAIIAFLPLFLAIIDEP